MKQMLRFLYVFLLFASSLSCKKYLAIEDVDGRFLIGQVFSSDSAANSAMAGIYRSWRDLNNSVLSPSVLCGLSADELRTHFPSQLYDDYYKNQISPNNAALPWASLYNIIYQANAFLESIDKSAKVSETYKNYYKGEAKFIRAHSYFNLVNLFGDVPLLLTTDIRKNSLAKRDATQTVYQQIVEDLSGADSLMQQAIFSPTEKERLNESVAKAFLGRVYLFLENWTDAFKLSNQVIQSGRYRLLVDLDGVFASGSAEAIFQFSNNQLDGNAESIVFIPDPSPRIVCSVSLIKAFESDDLRRLKWIKSGIDQGNEYFYPHKYNAANSSDSQLYTLFRYSEQYLIRAEAALRLHYVLDAVNDLNIVRARAGLKKINTDISEDSCVNAIIHERRVELFAETGHRWFDLKRTAQIDEAIKFEKGNLWITSSALYPIPAADIQRNPNLAQNLNY